MIAYLKTDGLSVGYNNRIVVDGIDLSAARGEIVTLIGPNGAGKSTVLRSIIGQLKLLGGDVIVDDKSILKTERAELAKKVSVLMTDRIKTELLTVMDVVSLARYPYTGMMGILSGNDIRIVDEALETVNASSIADEEYSHLSDGQKQRVMLARCIAQQSDLIVLDEPTSFLDIKYKAELLEILSKLKREKKVAILMSLHELELARRVSDRVICIGRDGIDRIGTPDEIFTPGYICSLFDISRGSYDLFFGTEDEGNGHENGGDDDGLKEADGNEKDGYVSRGGKLLRKGITTGTCSAAAAYAATEYLLKGEKSDTVSLLTPSGKRVKVPVYQGTDCGTGSDEKREPVEASCHVIKDSGDDPDVTNHAKIAVSVRRIKGKDGDGNICDINGTLIGGDKCVFEDEEHPGLFLTGGTGVGIVTKEGLEQPVGYPAINRVPRQMIFDAVDKVRNEADYDGSLLITVSVEDGKALAGKTFNPMLGIEGGVSILGTSGILEPMSDKAIVDTIEVLIRQQSAQGFKSLLVTPGQYGQGYVRNGLGLDLSDSVKCSNHIGETIDMAVSYGFTHLLLVGNLGKLVKLAAGVMNTHSAVADTRMEIICTHLAMCGGDPDMVKSIYECINTDAALTKLKEWGLFDEAIAGIINAINRHVVRRSTQALKTGVMIWSEQYGFLGQTEYADEALAAYAKERNITA